MYGLYCTGLKSFVGCGPTSLFGFGFSSKGDSPGSARANGRQGCIIVPSLGPVFLLKNWQFAITHKKFVASDRPILVSAHDAATLPPVSFCARQISC